MAHLHQTDRDISRLHPAIRDKVKKIQAELKKANNPLEVFEAFRTPQRQAMLKKKRPKVTWTGPWGSIHQYGLAVDFVIRTKSGGWSWDDTGDNAKYWTQMHEIAQANGMTPLFNSKGQLMEKPHVQLAGVSSAEMRKGQYPDGGDAIWAEHLGMLIDSWDGPEAPPPMPELAPQRPALDPADQPESDVSDKVAAVLEQASGDARFQKLNAFVAKSEGGFVNHPADKGGATNMGITQATLAEWRGEAVSVEDVRSLTRAEADAIYWARYYTVNRCPEMPERMAMVVYNCGVLSGPKRAVEFIQKGFNRLGMMADGKPLEEDGILGPMTMSAVRQTDPSVLAEAFMDVQESYLRGLDNFDVFGAGWMNRMGALRAFVNTLAEGAGLRPKTVMKISDGKLDLDDILKAAIALKTGGKDAVVRNIAAVLLEQDEDDSPKARRNKAVLELLVGDKIKGAGPAVDPVTVVNDADGKPPLTPVNAALGETVGRAMNGKKSVTGVVGLLLTTFLPELGLSGDIVSFLSEHSQTLITLFSLVTGWGFLGKIDKAVRLMNRVT